MFTDMTLLVISLVFWMIVFVMLGLIYIIDQVHEVKAELRMQHHEE